MGKHGEEPGALVRTFDEDLKEAKPVVNLNRAGPWGTRFRLSADNLYELRVTVFDVNREDWVDKMGDFVKGVFGVIGGAVSKVLKPLVDETATGVGKRMVKGDDKVLVVLSETGVDAENGKKWTLQRYGYDLEFTATPITTSTTTRN